MTDRQPVESTAALIYEHTQGGPSHQLGSLDSIDAKAVQIFAAASVVLGFGTFTSADLTAATGVLYAAAAVAYGFAGWNTLMALAPRPFRVTDGADRWWPSCRYARTAAVREQLLDDITAAFANNRRHLDSKGRRLIALMGATAIETLFVATAVIGSAI